MKCEISEFVFKCIICQQVKAKHQVPSGLLQPVMILEWKWERVTMNFFRVSKIVRFHDVLLSIISDCDTRFTSRFWGRLHAALGSQLNSSIDFHSQMDDQSE
ncbi:integrase [Gossypium australe]|uniref:Integrase n=1 Tax=Gossypium australe TaxID=47621 RepID=A0A5B6VBX6_9ROSI|nr:integrase [Gossypium australe]